MLRIFLSISCSLGEKFQDTMGGRIHLRELRHEGRMSAEASTRAAPCFQLTPPGLENILDLLLKCGPRCSNPVIIRGAELQATHPRLSKSSLNFNNNPQAMGVCIRVADAQPRAPGGPHHHCPRPCASPALLCLGTHLAASSRNTNSRGDRQR